MVNMWNYEKGVCEMNLLVNPNLLRDIAVYTTDSKKQFSAVINISFFSAV